MKIDLHLHSNRSKRPSQWVLQKIGCPESFSAPELLYRLTREKGMSAFTLTDHNTIDGCLEAAHLDGAFVSEEVTTYFPEDGCKVHVLVWNIDEAIHRDVQRARENIYDLIGYLQQNNVFHALAHPLFSVNDRLTLDHVEKFLLLFRTFELNGARDELQNEVIRSLVEGLTREEIETLADKHGLEPGFAYPWKKNLTAGSDDHSALDPARAYTEVPEASSLEEFLVGVDTGRGRPQGRGSTPRSLARNLYGIAYQYFDGRFNLGRFTDKDLLVRFLDRLLRPEPHGTGWMSFKLRGLLGRRNRIRLANSNRVQDVIRHEGARAISGNPELSEIIRGHGQDGRDKEEQWFRFLNRVSNKVLGHFSTDLFHSLSGADVFNIFGALGAAGSLYALMAPYFVAYGLFGRDRRLLESIGQGFPRVKETGLPDPGAVKVAHFTDTFHEINGVASTLRQQADLAEKTGRDLTIITCARNQPDLAGRVRNFEPVEVFELPEYPEQKLFVPPFLEILRYVYEEGFTCIHSATPGPLGLAALAAARILHLPISGTYHTAIPQYAAYLTGDEAVEQLVWRYTIWYYDQMESIYVPSRDTGRELTDKGIAAGKILQYPRGVDVERFHPGRRNGYYKRHFGLDKEFKLLYVGRVSKEKNLPLLVDVFKRVCRLVPDVRLVVIGDGPYLPEMKKALAGWPCTFAGYVQGMDLAEAYAGADLFVFPSTTDTFGNVILEAQASGLPVVVTDAGGPSENVLPGRTGLVIPGDDVEAMVQAVTGLIADPARLGDMSEAARSYMEGRSFENAFLEHWKLYSRESRRSHESAGRND